MAAILQTLQHAHDERARQPIQRVIGLYAVIDDWQAFMRLCDSLDAPQHSFYEISSKIMLFLPSLSYLLSTIFSLLSPQPTTDTLPGTLLHVAGVAPRLSD
jgi:hypothetical protein